ncbi:MAG: hypothetical protein GSR86_04440 [Desulfurococcales archaeon]|nr:hypothetical protein [Desulfurococcales archaeon]
MAKRPELPSILMVAGFTILVLVARTTGSITLGILASLPLFIIGELLYASKRVREEGVLEDEMESTIVAQSSRVAITVFTLLAGLAVVASLMLGEHGVISLSSYQKGFIDGVALSILVIIAIAFLASIYYRRVGIGWGASR